MPRTNLDQTLRELFLSTTDPVPTTRCNRVSTPGEDGSRIGEHCASPYICMGWSVQTCAPDAIACADSNCPILRQPGTLWIISPRATVATVISMSSPRIATPRQYGGSHFGATSDRRPSDMRMPRFFKRSVSS